MRIGIVVPHIFMHPAVLPEVIFSPGHLALALAEGLQAAGDEVILFAPGKVTDKVPMVTADMTYFDRELAGRGDSYVDLLKKHPFTFVTLARQVQSELLASAYAMANRDELDIVHVYSNEEDIALPFAQLCTKPVIFTHHDPFNFLVKYKNVFPKYPQLNWLSMSLAQRKGMPPETNWIANIYHGLQSDVFQPVAHPSNDYIAYVGRMIEAKGLHLAIAAVQKYNQAHPEAKIHLKIAGKHYSDNLKDTYWQKQIVPLLDDDIEYVGFINNDVDKAALLANARALIVPSIFEEPFGMVMIEALACGTPIIGLDSGAIPEVIQDGQTGTVVAKHMQEARSFRTHFNGVPAREKTVDAIVTATRLSEALTHIDELDRAACRADFEARFTFERMIADHQAAYQKISTLR